MKENQLFLCLHNRLQLQHRMVLLVQEGHQRFLVRGDRLVGDHVAEIVDAAVRFVRVLILHIFQCLDDLRIYRRSKTCIFSIFTALILSPL